MDFLGLFHTACGLVALGSGLAVAAQRKGTTRHRRIGWVYVVSLLALNVTALTMYRLTGAFNFFHGAALASLVVLFLGMLPTRSGNLAGRNLANHAFFMSGSLVGVLAATAAEIATRAFTGHVALAAIVCSSAVCILGAFAVAQRVQKILTGFPKLNVK